MTPPLRQKLKRTKKPLDESERGVWKSWLKAQYSEIEDHGIWSHHLMANWWGNSGKSQLMQRVDSLEKTLMLGGIGGRRGRVWQWMRWLVGITDSMDAVWVNSGSWWGTWRPGMLWFMGSQRVGHNWVTELNWTEMNRGTVASSHYWLLSPSSLSGTTLAPLHAEA